MEYKTISLELFWNCIAIPFFLLTLSFGFFVLFNVNGIQLADTQSVYKMLDILERKATHSNRLK
jgi:hypothetical protein